MRRVTLAIAAVAIGMVIAVAANPAGQRADRALAADAMGRWIDHPCLDCLRSLLATDDVVWAGTASGGIVRHDLGSGNVTHYGMADGLGGRSIEWIAESPDGGLWASTRESLLDDSPSVANFLDGHAWKVFDEANGFTAGRVVDIAAGLGGTAWIAGTAGLLYFDGARWLPQPLPPLPDGTPASVHAVARNPRRDVYAATDDGVFTGSGLGWTALPLSGLPSLDVARLKVDATGRLWAVVGSGAAQFDPGGWPSGDHWRFHDLGLGNGTQDSRRIEITLDGAVWVFGNDSIWSYDGAEWGNVSDTLTQPPGRALVGWHVSASGRLWRADLARGLAAWNGSAWEPHLVEVGPTNLISFAITVDPADNVWTGFVGALSPDNLVNRFDGTVWRHFGVSDGMLSSKGTTLGVLPNAIDAGNDGSIWVGVDGVGVAGYVNDAWVTIPITDAFGTSTRISVVEADDQGGAWIGTDAGAAHFDGALWSRFGTAEGLPSDEVEAIAVEHGPSRDVVWFGTNAGAARWDGADMTVFTTGDGLAANEVSGITVDSRGNVWFVTLQMGESGVTRFDGVRWHVFTTRDGLPADSAWGVVADSHGGVWAARPLPDFPTDRRPSVHLGLNVLGRDRGEQIVHSDPALTQATNDDMAVGDRKVDPHLPNVH